MRKILIIAYSFPPNNFIAAQRPYRLAKYFPKYGWEPIVLTVERPGEHPKNIRIIETDYNDIKGIIKSMLRLDPAKTTHEQLGIRMSNNLNHPTWKTKFLKFVSELISYPDEQRGWYKFAVKCASDFLIKERVDVIFSTSYPVTSHLIARKLKQKYKIKWIADLRDTWTQNPYPNKSNFLRYFERRLELKTLSDADALVTVTEPWIDTLKTLHKNKKVYCVTNGFDEDEFPNTPMKVTEKFTITYTGILYNGKRDPSLLFEVIAHLIKENIINRDLIEIRFYGPKENWLVDKIKKFNLEGVVFTYGSISREEALKKQRESQILLLLLWDNKNEEGFCPAKIYEYFGSKRPIIATGWTGSIVKELLERTNAGRLAENSKDLEDIILKYYEDFIKFGEVRCHSNSNIDKFTYNSVTKRYSEILERLVSE